MCGKDFITQRSVNLQVAIFIIILTLSFCFYCHLNSDTEHLYFQKCILCACVCTRTCACVTPVVIVFHCGRAVYCRAHLKHDGATQKPDLVFQQNGWVRSNWRGASVQSTTSSWGVRISGSNCKSNAVYTMFWGRVQDYWLPNPLACFPFTSPTVRHRVPSGFIWALHMLYQSKYLKNASLYHTKFSDVCFIYSVCVLKY